jgi:geranylgeranyl diphosphate synthase type I
MKIEGAVGDFKRKVDEELAAFLDSKVEEGRKNGMTVEYFEVVGNIRDYILRGGKRLRPLLFYYGYILSGGREETEAIRVSIALEFLHAYFIIHDDIIDQDLMRHGGLSMHAQYEKVYGKKYPGKDIGHFGEAVAIIAGDIVSAWSYELLAHSDFSDKDKVRALGKLASVDQETSTGQLLDEFLEMGSVFNEDMIYNVQNLKTARYTVRGPLQLGAIMAGAGDRELDFIDRFAVPLGIAYQLRDDILGVFGEQDNTGKPVGADIREGKKTLLISYALDHAAPDDRAFVLHALGSDGVTAAELSRVREIIKDSGALQYSEDKIDELMEKTISSLHNGPADFTGKYVPLEGFAEFLLKRNK